MKITEYEPPQPHTDLAGMPCKVCKKTLNIYKVIEGHHGMCRVYECDNCLNDAGYPIGSWHSVKALEKRDLKEMAKNNEEDLFKATTDETETSLEELPDFLEKYNE